MYVPLLLVLLNSFNASRVCARGHPRSSRWCGGRLPLENNGARDALIESLTVAALATVIALLLGSMIAFAIARYSVVRS